MKRLVLILFMAAVAAGVHGQILSSREKAKMVNPRYSIKITPTQSKISDDGKLLVLCVIEHGDTMPCYTMSNIWVYPKRVFKNRRDKKRYDRMVRDVKVALPVVEYIEGVMRRTNDTLMKMDTKKQRDNELLK